MYPYGLTGFGNILPWGSVVHPDTPIPPISTAGEVQLLGILEATTGAIAEEDNDIGGFALTRLTNAHVKGTTTLNVESTLGWPDTGRIGIDGIVYYYTGKTDTTLTGITHIASSIPVSGTAIDHRSDTAVIDVSEQRSALERLRRSFLVRYAEEDDLNVLGRNLGVPRLPIFGDDDQYRTIIQSMAYCPKGTTQGLELALTGLVGAGNFEIYEDLIKYHNTVFIKINSDILIESSAIGKMYLTGHAWNTLSGMQNTIVIADTPITVEGVKLKDLEEEFDFRNAIPSAVVYPYWEGETPNNAFTYAGSVSEGTGVTQVSNSHVKFKTNALNGTVYYNILDTQGSRIVPESYVELSTTLQIPTGSILTLNKLLQVALVIADGSFLIRAGIQNTRAFGLFATESGGHLGNTITLALDQFYDITIKKFGTDKVELWVDNQFIDSQPYSAFTAVTGNHRVSFGIMGTPAANTEAWFKELNLNINNAIDYWSAREIGTGRVTSASPSRFILSGSPYAFIPSDAGKGFSITGSTITNPQGGNNNGNWLIDAFISGTTIELIGLLNKGANFSIANPKRITVTELDSFKYPDDLGKQIIISNSLEGNNGTYVIEKLLQPGSFTDFSTFETPLEETTNICEVVAATFTTEIGASWQLKPVFVTEFNLDWAQASAGSFSGSTLNLRQPLWANGLVMEVGVSNVLTGQLLIDTDIANYLVDPGPPPLYEYYPFYLVDPIGAIGLYIDDITAAGVIPQILLV